MGGDKKISHRYFERGGHGKTVIAEATLTDEASGACSRRPDDLLELAFVGTHGAVASGMQSVAFTPATAIAALFIATGPGRRHGRDELDGARHGVPGRRRPARVHPPARASRSRPSAGGRPSPTRAPGSGSWAATGRARSTASRRSSRRRRLRSRSPPRPRWPRPARRTSTAPTSSEAGLGRRERAHPAAPRPGLLGVRRQPGRHPSPAPSAKRVSSATRRR